MKMIQGNEPIAFVGGLLLLISGAMSVDGQVPPTAPPPATVPPARTFPPPATIPPGGTAPPPITRPAAPQLVITNQIPLVPTNTVGGAVPSWGFAPHPVQGLNPHPVQGFAQTPVQGFTSKILMATTNQQTGMRTQVIGVFSNNMLVTMNTNTFLVPTTVPPGTRALSAPSTNNQPSPF